MTSASLVLSNLTGHDSHGVVRIADYCGGLERGELQSGVSLEVVDETASSCLADAHRGLGQVMMPRLLSILLAKAAGQACATAAMRNCGHAGRLGEWVTEIAKAGMAGMVAVNDNGALRFVAPPGGRRGCTSTNPVAFAIPLGGDELFSVDMSTSAIAMGKVRLAYHAGRELPAGVLQDSEGRPTNDPAVMFESPRGAVLPIGGQQGYKGFGLSMVIDLLTAGLSGGHAPPAPAGAVSTNNVLVTIWNPARFAGLGHMREQARQYLDFLRGSEPIVPEMPIRLAGDRAEEEHERRSRGGVPLDTATVETLCRTAERYGVSGSERIFV